MMNYMDVLFNILISITASFFFWLISFKVSFTKVIFANHLANPDDTFTNMKEFYGLRVRFANVGLRDLIEITVVVKMAINDDTRDYTFLLDIADSGEQTFITFMPGILTNKIKKRSSLRTYTIYPSKSMQHELSKKKYPKRIRKIAKKGQLQFEDVFKEYGKKVKLIVCIYGNDKTTGTRKMFESQHYTMDDIVDGEFYGSKEIQIPVFRSKKVKQGQISRIHRKVDL